MFHRRQRLGPATVRPSSVRPGNSGPPLALRLPTEPAEPPTIDPHSRDPKLARLEAVLLLCVRDATRFADVLPAVARAIFVAQWEGQRLGWAQYGVAQNHDLDIPRGHLGILRFLAPHTHLARHAQAGLVADFSQVRKVGGIEDQLNQAGSVAQVDKAKTAQIADLVRPAIERHLLTGVLSAKLAA